MDIRHNGAELKQFQFCDCGLDDRNSIPGCGWDIVLLATASTLTLGPIHPPVQGVPRVKRSRLEAEHFPLSSSEVKNVWSYASNPAIYLHGVVLNSARDTSILSGT
jgi:hypothetical protein